AAFIGFTTPSAVLMLLAASGLLLVPREIAGPSVQGLMLVAVSVVAHAVFGMARTLCRTWATALIAALSAIALISIYQAWLQAAVIAAGAIIGLMLPMLPDTLPEPPVADGGSRYSIGLLALFAALLAGLPLLAAMTMHPAIEVMDAF